VVLHDYAVRDLKKTNDMRAVAAANPLKSLNAKVLREKRKDPTLIDEHWLRFTCNIAAQASGQAINAAEWDACKGKVKLDDAESLFLGVDIGQVHDSSAVVQVGFVGEKLHVRSRIWTPTPGKPITVREVESHIIELAEAEEVAEVAFDPMRFNRSAEILEERSIMMVEFPQTDLRMHEASSTLLALIREGQLVHDGDPELRSHVLAGVAAETDRGWRFSKKKSGAKRKIDALIALAMASQRAVVDQGRANPSIRGAHLISRGISAAGAPAGRRPHEEAAPRFGVSWRMSTAIACRSPSPSTSRRPSRSRSPAMWSSNGPRSTGSRSSDGDDRQCRRPPAHRWGPAFVAEAPLRPL
jgi:phage terminase large subunit-like protein